MHDVDKTFGFDFINKRKVSLSQRRVSNQKVLILARIPIEVAKNNHFLASLNQWRCLVENPIRFPVFAGPEMDLRKILEGIVAGGVILKVSLELGASLVPTIPAV